MFKIKQFMFYCGTPEWGWKMWGIGYETKWFLGFSMNANNIEEVSCLK